MAFPDEKIGRIELEPASFASWRDHNPYTSEQAWFAIARLCDMHHILKAVSMRDA
jgi:hypothetical protein